MAITDENSGIGATMLVGPTGYGAGMPYPVYQGGNNNGLGGDLWGVILLIALLNGGFGFGGMGGWGGMMGMGMMDGMWTFPWLINGQNQINANTNSGFRDSMLNDGINGIRDSIGGISTQLCNGFAGVNATINGTAANAETAANARAIANMQQLYGLSSQFADCCCEQRLGIANLGAQIAREACDTRVNNTQNTQSILNVITGGIQSIKDQLCQDKIDAKDDIIAQLRQENLYARGQASQVEQTARILAGQAAEIDGVYNRLKNCPVGTVPVFGNQPIWTCGQNVVGNNCGCGNGFAN